MEDFFLVLTMLEMLCVNMYIFHICSQKRVSTFVIILVISIFTVLLLGISQLFLKDTGSLGGGGGIVYLLPLAFLYRQPVSYSVSIMGSCWIYTMLIYVLSAQISSFFPQWNYQASLLAVQTGLYALTIIPFFRFVTKKFIYIIKNADQKTKKLLLWLGISWCLFGFLLNYTMILDMPSFSAKIAKTLFLCTSGANALMTYQILYSFRRENQNALEYESALRIDALTMLKNRTAFFEEAQELIDSKIPFTIFFIDLNNFKSINDNYGHMKGDLYLKQFSKNFSAALSPFGTVYRISGDEFVFLYINGGQEHSIYKKIGCFKMNVSDDIPFKGFSIGSASYPKDAQTLNLLVAAADKRMYEEKKMRDKTGDVHSIFDEADNKPGIV